MRRARDRPPEGDNRAPVGDRATRSWSTPSYAPSGRGGPSRVRRWEAASRKRTLGDVSFGAHRAASRRASLCNETIRRDSAHPGGPSRGSLCRSNVCARHARHRSVGARSASGRPGDSARDAARGQPRLLTPDRRCIASHRSPSPRAFSSLSQQRPSPRVAGAARPTQPGPLRHRPSLLRHPRPHPPRRLPPRRPRRRHPPRRPRRAHRSSRRSRRPTGRSHRRT